MGLRDPAGVDDRVHHRERRPVFEDASQLVPQQLVVDRREVLADIHLQRVPILSGEALISEHGPMCALFKPIRPGVMDQPPVELGSDHVTQGMMRDPVPIRRR